jgi:hypothetical protein
MSCVGVMVHQLVRPVRQARAFVDARRPWMK